METLVRLTKNQIKPASQMLGRAFWDDPIMVHIFPDEQERKTKIAYAFEFLIRYVFRYGEAYITSQNIEGAALWLYSENVNMSFGRAIRAGALSAGLRLGSAGDRFRHFGESMSSTHRRLTPSRHLYLQMLGVDPQYQGQGYAGKLLKPVLARMDRESLPCYLETQEGKNVPLYEHFGFRVIEEFTIPDTTFRNWAMLRGPRH